MEDKTAPNMGQWTEKLIGNLTLSIKEQDPSPLEFFWFGIRPLPLGHPEFQLQNTNVYKCKQM